MRLRVEHGPIGGAHAYSHTHNGTMCMKLNRGWEGVARIVADTRRMLSTLTAFDSWRMPAIAGHAQCALSSASIWNFRRYSPHFPLFGRWSIGGQTLSGGCGDFFRLSLHHLFFAHTHSRLCVGFNRSSSSELNEQRHSLFVCYFISVSNISTVHHVHSPACTGWAAWVRKQYLSIAFASCVVVVSSLCAHPNKYKFIFSVKQLAFAITICAVCATNVWNLLRS